MENNPQFDANMYDIIAVYWGRLSNLRATIMQHFLWCFPVRCYLVYMQFPLSPLLPCEKYIIEVACEYVCVSKFVWKQKFHLSNDLQRRGQKNEQ